MYEDRILFTSHYIINIKVTTINTQLSPKSFVPNMNIEEISLHAFAQVSMS